MYIIFIGIYPLYVQGALVCVGKGSAVVAGGRVAR